MPRYKRLGSSIYNFGSSFISMTSWYDGEYTVDTLARAAGQLELDEVVIWWWRDEGRVFEPEVKPPAVSDHLRLALVDYQARLPRLFTDTGAALDMLRWLRMRIFFNWDSLQMTTRLLEVPLRGVMEAEDERGHTYKVALKTVHAHLH